MKIVASIITFFLAFIVNPNLVSGASLRKKALDASPSGNNFERRNLGQLNSQECASMINKKLTPALQLVTQHSTAEVADYICNSVQRKKAADNQKEMENNMATQMDMCTKAYNREMSKTKAVVRKAVNSIEACESEITKEVQALKQVVPKGAVMTRDSGDDLFADLGTDLETAAGDIGDVLSDVGDMVANPSDLMKSIPMIASAVAAF